MTTSSTLRPLLQNGPLLPWLEQQLAQRFDVQRLPTDGAAQGWLREHGARFELMATSARIGASRALVDGLPRLKAISSFGVGYDAFDLPQARERGLQIGYTPDVLNDCVADTAFGLLMDVARRFSEADRYTRAGHWLKAPFPLSTRVSGKRLGIVGLGRIGRVVARRASGFDMEVRYHNRRPLSDVPYAYEADLADLARWADFLVVIAAGGGGTQNLIDARILDALGPKGYLINVSRGSVIDQAALVQALQGKRIAGAGLDVYADEPRVPAELLALDNAVLLPHVASATHETRQAMAQRVLDNLDGWLATGRIPVAVTLG
jgi:lactate dehydrogenase-like 2-hydroxyacid dehydrogenase